MEALRRGGLVMAIGPAFMNMPLVGGRSLADG